MTKRIIAAGMNRSGSSLIFNAIRLSIIEEFGHTNLYSCFINDYDPNRKEMFHLIKVHDRKSLQKIGYDALVTSYRDLRAVTGSMLRMGWLADEESQILSTLDNYTENFRYFSARANLCLRYEHFCYNPKEIVKAIPSLFGFSGDIEFEERVIEQLTGVLPPAGLPSGNLETANATTLLHRGHIGSIQNSDAMALLSEEAVRLIEERYEGWLNNYGYPLPK